MKENFRNYFNKLSTAKILSKLHLGRWHVFYVAATHKLKSARSLHAKDST